MAENKASFILYCDINGLVNQLPDDLAGQLFKHILGYVNDENPTSDNLLLNIAFDPIKRQLKRDLKKYEDGRRDKSESGRLGNLKRWYIDLYNDILDKKLTLEEAENIAKHRKTSQPDKVPSQTVANIAVTVTEHVTEHVTVPVNEILKVDDYDEKASFQKNERPRHEHPTPTVYENIETWHRNFNSNQILIERTCMSKKIEKKDLLKMENDFYLNQKMLKTRHKDESDYLKHFVNSLKFNESTPNKRKFIEADQPLT